MSDAKKLGAVIDPIEGGMPERLLADPDVQRRLTFENARLRTELAAAKSESERLFRAGEKLIERAQKADEEARVWFEQVQTLRAELAAEREKSRSTLTFVRDRIKRIHFLAGLDEPIREQTSMAKDAIDAALGGGDE